MPVYAKPYGGYDINSNEAKQNLISAYAYFSQNGYTVEAVCGILANAYSESGLNPWRWQMNSVGVDTVDYSKGYGFFQFTPASGYINGMKTVPGYAPNLSTTQQTSGANTSDFTAQLDVMVNDRLSKWMKLCWREGPVYPTWEAEKANNGQLWQLRRELLNRWSGTGANELLQTKFKEITNIRHATFAFYACYEGSQVITDVNARFPVAQKIYEILQGQPPVPPPKAKKMKLMLYLRRPRYG